MSGELRWAHHATCPGADAAAWWAQTPLVWAYPGEPVIEQWRCPACGSHVARQSLYPVYAPRDEAAR